VRFRRIDNAEKNGGKMIGATRNMCPEFLPGQAQIQDEPDEEAEMSEIEED
jgi:hypothetical protein